MNHFALLVVGAYFYKDFILILAFLYMEKAIGQITLNDQPPLDAGGILSFAIVGKVCFDQNK